MKKLKIILLVSIVLTAIYVFNYINNFEYKYTDFFEYEGVVTDISNTKDKNRFVIDKKILVNDYNQISKVQLGDYVIIKGKSKIPENNTNFYQFNYKKYLLSKKIYYLFTLDEIEIKSHTNNIIYKIRNKINERLNSINNSYINTLIFADNKIDDEIYESYKTNGITHLFAISGMHISFISFILLLIINKVLKNKKISTLIVALILVFYTSLLGPVISALRSTLFYLSKSVLSIINIKIRSIYILLLILIFFLIYNPFFIYNLSFLYSFIITTSLLIYKDKIQSKNYYISLFKVSVLSFLVSLPITINSTYEINVLTPFINVIFIPLISFLLLPLTLTTFLIPSTIIMLNIVINIFEKISIFISNYSLIINIPHIPYYLVVIYYIILIISINKRKHYIIIYIVFLYYINVLNHDLTVTMLDVKQGDSILITKQNNSVLIDTGGLYNTNLTSQTLIPVFKSKGIKKLDYLIITHGDYDHMGEAINLVNSFKVENVIFNCGPVNDIEEELIKALEKKQIKYHSCTREINVNKLKLENLSTREYDNENDNSNVIYLNYHNNQFLIMGDAGTLKEKDILEKYNIKNIDFLKVGHHGSNTSSSNYFIDNIKPKYSLISVGKNNRYGHPKNEVLATLKNSKIYRTDLDGSIEIKLNKNGYKIRTCPP